MTRPSWDEYGMILAQAAKSRAACTRRQVGAAILNQDHRCIGLGYNGTPTGDINCTDGGCPRGRLTYDECPAYGSYSNCKGKHAEVNAIEDAVRRGQDLRGATLYVTYAPCAGCEIAMHEAGITNVHHPDVH